MATTNTPDQSDSLDNLLAESMAGAAFSLDDLLAESMKAKKDEMDVRASRALVAKGGVDPEARKAMEASIRAWELKREWTAEADVAMFSRQFCEQCDCYHVQFLGFFQRQSHRQSKVARWVKAGELPKPAKKLPKEVKYEDELVANCEDCAKLAGYPIED